MAIRIVGFSELRGGRYRSQPSIRDLVTPEPHPDEAGGIAYLEQGTRLVYRMGSSPTDVIDGSPLDGSLNGHTLSDGLWAWSDELPYYVRKYHVRLPAEFTAHMASNGWKVPELTEEERLRAELEVFAEWERIKSSVKSSPRRHTPGGPG